MKRVALVLAFLSLSGFSAASAEATPIVIIDTLGAASPTTQFEALGGSSGFAIGFVSEFLPSLLYGPFFKLNQPTLITEIGGFVQTCFDCSAPAPAFVRIYPEVNAFPHLENVIAAFTLSNDGTADLFSYESVAPNLLLGAGNYYALFGSPTVDTFGTVLSSAFLPFFYNSLATLSVQVDSVTCLTPGPGCYAELIPAVGATGAVRILGTAVPEPSTLLLLALGLAMLMLTSRKAWRRS